MHTRGQWLSVGKYYRLTALGKKELIAEQSNRMILSVIFGLTTEQMQAFDQANDELYLIELEQGSSPHLWKLITEANLKDL